MPAIRSIGFAVVVACGLCGTGLRYADAGDAAAVDVEVVEMPAGTFDLAEVLTRSGTPERWLVYRPAVPGTVVVRGGRVEGVTWVVLEGLVVDGRLHADFPERAQGLDVRVSNVVIRDCELSGPHDVHTGYDATDGLNCKEYASGIPSGGINVRAGLRNVLVENCTIHGFRESASFDEGTSVTIRDSLLRNNFNGVSFRGEELTMQGNVMWVHPNHQFSIHAPEGVVRLHDNLFVDAQDMVKAGANWAGCREIHLVHNTFWIPANKPCYGYAGLQLNRVTGRVVVRDNVVVNKRKGWLAVDKALLASVEADHNLYFHHEEAGADFFAYRDGEAVTEIDVASWQSATGADRHSSFTLAPTFVDAPRYAESLPEQGEAANDWGFWTPPTREAARARFALRAGSAGKGAASDGGNVGILP